MEEITRRICKICKIDKPISEFERSPSKSNPYRNQCKCCRYEQKLHPQRQKRQPWTKERAKQYQHEHYIKNKQKYSQRTKSFYQQNKGWLAEWRKNYYQENRETELRQTRAYKDEKLKTDVAFKLECNVRGRLGSALRKLGVTKSKRTIELVGCTSPELKAYLESKFYNGMTWDKLGIGEGMFQIDHIIPVALFDITDPQQQAKCFHYTNLQPLWDDDHKKKTKEDMKTIRARKHA